MQTRNIIRKGKIFTGLLAFVLTLTAGGYTAVQANGSYDDEKKTEKSFEEAQKLFKEAKSYLNRDEYKKAAELYEKVYDRYADSDYAADALYWRAFSLHRLGGKSALRDARTALEIQADKYRRAYKKNDSEALYYLVLGKLAELGDSEAARLVAEGVDEKLDRDDDSDTDEDLEMKLAAIHALLNMPSERAVPILEGILSDRRPGRGELRKQALFVLSQKAGDDGAELLMKIAREDPDRDVRKQAVFWMSQAPSENTIDFLEELLTETDDPEMRNQAIFAISQHPSGRSKRALQKIAMDEEASSEVREQAIFWLGQSGGAEQIEFLMDLYGRIDEENLKEKIIFAVSQNSGREGARWLLKIVHDDKEPMDMRKNALFWAGQQAYIDLDELLKLYKSIPDFEMRKQVIFVMSQRSETKAVEMMMQLARTEKNIELRKQLLFWIGQSNDPRVADFLLEIIND